MIDIHSHLLPQIDDGSRSAEQSAKTLRHFVEHGVRGVVLTPHVRASEIAVDPDDAIERRALALDRLRAIDLPEVTLHLGFEIMLDQALPALATGDRRYALAESRYYLVEFPLAVVGSLAGRVLGELARTGVTPIVAHPERYDACSPTTIAGWRQTGARVQVDATTLTRSTTRGVRARELVSHGLADIVAADNHGGRRTVMVAYEYLVAQGADQQAALLCKTNPRSVIADEPLTDVPPFPLKERLLDRWRRFVKG